MILVDTNVVSEFRKLPAGRAEPVFTAWARDRPATTLFLSVVTVMELEVGIRRLKRRDPGQAVVLRAWLDGDVFPTFANRILSYDIAVAPSFTSNGRASNATR